MYDKPDLSQKELDAEAIAIQALADERILPELLDGISPESKKHIIRTNSFNALLILAEQHPEVLFPRWDYLVELLQSDNGFSQYPAIHLIAALAPSDDAGRFEAIFDTFYSLLNDKSVMVAGGGPAGMKAACTAAERGHDVTLVEKQSSLGGQVLLNRHIPGRSEMVTATLDLINNLRALNITVFLEPGLFA